MYAYVQHLHERQASSKQDYILKRLKIGGFPNYGSSLSLLYKSVYMCTYRFNYKYTIAT